MTVLDFTDRQKDISFSGIKHRLFIEGRGFDFRTFEISHLSNAKIGIKWTGRSIVWTFRF